MRPTAARRCRPVPVPDSAAATNIPWVERPRTPDREPRKSSPADSPPLRTARVVPECPHSSTSSLIAPPRSLRSRRSVKDVPEHCVKDVMELNTPSAVQASATRRRLLFFVTFFLYGPHRRQIAILQ